MRHSINQATEKPTETQPLIPKYHEDFTMPNWKRYPYQMFSISSRKFNQLKRNRLILFFEILIPTIEILLFMMCIGPTPVHLKFAVSINIFATKLICTKVINQDTGYDYPDRPSNFGNDTVYYLNQGNDLELYQHYTLDEARHKVQQGESK